jgi:hypothetical protein
MSLALERMSLALAFRRLDVNQKRLEWTFALLFWNEEPLSPIQRRLEVAFRCL